MSGIHRIKEMTKQMTWSFDIMHEIKSGNADNRQRKYNFNDGTNLPETSTKKMENPQYRKIWKDQKIINCQWQQL